MARWRAARREAPGRAADRPDGGGCAPVSSRCSDRRSAALALALTVASTGVLDQLEHATVKARFAKRGEQPTAKDVVIVALDDASIDDLHVVAPPGPRTLHARLLKRLRAAKPRVIAYDIRFYRRRSDREDGPLKLAISRAQHVVLAATTVYEGGETRVLGSTATVESLGAHVGVAGFPPTADIYYDRMTQTADGLPTFAYEAARLAGARPPSRELDGKGIADRLRRTAGNVGAAALLGRRRGAGSRAPRCATRSSWSAGSTTPRRRTSTPPRRPATS